MEEILNNRVDVVREDGKTAAEVCREVIDILDDIIEYNAEDDILGYSSETIKAVQCLAVEKFTVSLLEGIM